MTTFVLLSHTTPEEFENGGFTLKTHQMFFVHTYHTRGIKKWNNHRSCWICVREKLGEGNHMIIVTPLFSKSSVFKVFSVHTKMKSRRFQIPPVWSAFLRKAPFSWQISVDSRPNRRNKAVFSNFSGVVWTVPWSYKTLAHLQTRACHTLPWRSCPAQANEPLKQFSGLVWTLP